MSTPEDRRAILDGREIILEVTVMGESARICAVDAATGIEAVAVAPANAARADMERLALNKLARLLSRSDAADPGKDRPSKGVNV